MRSAAFTTYLGTLLAVGVVALTAAVIGPRFCGASANPEGEIITLLKKTERNGLVLAVAGTDVPLTASNHHYDRIVVQVDYDRGVATAIATLDFTGKLGETGVSSLGLERVRFVYRDGDWVADGSLAPVLSGIVGVLEKRRVALKRADVVALAALWVGEPGQAVTAAHPDLLRLQRLKERDYQAQGWYIRSEREDVQVTEEYRLTGVLPQVPVDEQGRRKLSLILRDREFFFSPWLM